MRKLAIGLLATAGIALSVSAGAQSFGIYVGPDHPHYRHHHHWRGYADEPECRVIVRNHINRRGERVTMRRRSCD